MASFQNNGKLKLLIIVGTRPEIIRLAAVITKCRQYFDTLLAHTGQNYDYNLNGVFFHDLELADPDIYLDAVGDTLGQTMGNIIAKSYDLMVELQPDAVLVLGDTNSCLSVIGAKRLHIPIFHMEAGNRCKDECLPEETNRRIVDHIADVNLWAVHTLTGIVEHRYLHGAETVPLTLTQGRWRLYAVANHGSDLGTLDAEAVEALRADIPPHAPDDTDFLLPMAGRTETDVSGPASVTLTLERLAARVRLDIETAPEIAGRLNILEVQPLSLSLIHI